MEWRYSLDSPGEARARIDLRNSLLVLHISGAGVWLGANVLQAVVPRLIASQGQQAVTGWYRAAAKLSSRVYVPAAVVILITGVFLVLGTDEYGFGTRFVTVGFAMVVVGVVLGVAVFDRGSEQAADAIEARDESRIKSSISRLNAFGALDTLLILVTITAMVTRWS